MADAKNTSSAPDAGHTLPVLSTRLADVEPIMRPKIGRRPPGLERPQAPLMKPVLFGTKPAEEKPAAEATATPKRRVLTPSFIVVLLAVAVVLNFALVWLLDGQSAGVEVANKSAIILGAPEHTAPAPVKEIIVPAPEDNARAGDTVEVIPYRRAYDPELIERLEQQNPPAAGRLY